VANLYLPDTVLFVGEQPITWYFTIDGRVKTKQRAKLNVEEIQSHFLKRTTASGIVASLMRPGDNSDEPEIVCEYFDRDSFGRRA